MTGNSNNTTFSFVESGVILNTKNDTDLAKHNFKTSDFFVHKDAYDFLIDFFAKYKKAPELDTMLDKFPDLERRAGGEDLDYCIDTFRNQSLTRKTINIVKNNERLIIESPKRAISDIIYKLDSLNVSYDDDIYVYDNGSSSVRLREFAERRNIRESSVGKNLKIIGIPTPIRTINNYGIGLLPGEICSLVARPGVGKSWFAIKSAVISVVQNYRTLFVTAEMPAEQMSLRFDVFFGRVKGYNFSHTALKTGSVNVDVEEYEKFLNENDKNNLIIVDHIEEFGLSIQGISSLIRKYKPQVIVIDNMELLSLDGKSTKMWEKMHDIYYSLKTLCTANKIAAFVTHQANREASDPFKPPGKTEVSSGDALLRASDIVLSMCEMRDDDKKRLVSFQKFRDMPELQDKNYVVMNFDVDIGVFIES